MPVVLVSRILSDVLALKFPVECEQKPADRREQAMPAGGRALGYGGRVRRAGGCHPAADCGPQLEASRHRARNGTQRRPRAVRM